MIYLVHLNAIRCHGRDTTAHTCQAGEHVVCQIQALQCTTHGEGIAKAAQVIVSRTQGLQAPAENNIQALQPVPVHVQVPTAVPGNSRPGGIEGLNMCV